jgi:hypothetical protein
MVVLKVSWCGIIIPTAHEALDFAFVQRGDHALDTGPLLEQAELVTRYGS